MPTVQATYGERIPQAVAGQVANMTTFDADTRIVETPAGIGFGVAVSQGTADKQVLLGGASAAVFVGISMRDVTLDDPTNTDEYQEGENAAILTRGDIWVTTGGAVSAGDEVVFDGTTGVLSSAAPGAGVSPFAIAGARWMTSAGNGELAIVRLSGELPSA